MTSSVSSFNYFSYHQTYLRQPSTQASTGGTAAATGSDAGTDTGSTAHETTGTGGTDAADTFVSFLQHIRHAAVVAALYDTNDDVDTNGGEGDDLIHAVDSTILTGEGGAGNDTIVSAGNLFKGTVYGGAGEDNVTISGRAVKAYGGTGNDSLTFDNASSLVGYQQTEDGFVPATEFRSVADGGLGDDNLTFTNSYGDIEYHAGDGNDTITGADERSVLKLGKGLTFDDTTFTTEGNDLTLSFGGDAGGSITFKDYQTQGLPRIQFDGGRQLDASSTIAYAGGDPDAYTANDVA